MIKQKKTCAVSLLRRVRFWVGFFIQSVIAPRSSSAAAAFGCDSATGSAAAASGSGSACEGSELLVAASRLAGWVLDPEGVSPIRCCKSRRAWSKSAWATGCPAPAAALVPPVNVHEFQSAVERAQITEETYRRHGTSMRSCRQQSVRHRLHPTAPRPRRSIQRPGLPLQVLAGRRRPGGPGRLRHFVQPHCLNVKFQKVVQSVRRRLHPTPPESPVRPKRTRRQQPQATPRSQTD